MAVEIPVYVDIQGAFDRAVQAIPKEIPKLEKVISQHALKMKIDVGGEDMSIRRILTDTTLSANDLERALRAIRRAFDDAVVKNAKSSKTSATVNNLAKAYGLLEQRIKGVYDTNTVAAMRLEDTIAKVTFKIQDLKAKLATLTPGTDQFSKMNYEMMLQQKRLADLTKQHTLYKAGVDASNTSLIRQSSIVRQLTGYFSGLYAVHTVARFVKQIRDVTGELEYQRVALGHILQDVSYGNDLFDRIIEAAKQSPFRITQLVTYTKQFAAYRIEQENLYDTTMRLADISAGLGVDMNRLILAYGQVRAASVLRGQELRQFTEAGIPLVEELAKKFTKLKGEMVSTADVFKLISERAVPFEYIKEIIEEMTDAGGMFYKMQEEQAKTLKGRWEKLKDAYDQALMRLGDSETFQSWNDTVLKILNGVAKNLTGIVRVVNAASIGWITYRIATSNAAKSTVALVGANIKATASMIKMFGVTGTLRAGVVALEMAWKRFVAALSANWVGILLTVGATLVTYFTTFGKKTKEATGELNDMEKAIEKMKDANKEFEYGKGLIASYEELAKKTDRSSKENERMLDTLNELKTTFPELTSKINDDNLSLEQRLQIMRDVVDASHDAAVEEAKNRLNSQKEIIRGLEEDAKAAKLEKEAAQRRLEAAQTAEKIGPVPVSERYGPGTYSSAEDLKNNTIEAAKAAKIAADNYDEVAQNLATAVKEGEALEELINPKKKQKDWDEWQKQIKSLQDSMKEVGDTPVFTDDEIGKFTSVYDLSKKLEKSMKDLTVSIAGMKAMYDAMSDKESDAAKNLSSEIARREKTLQIAKAIKEMLDLTFKSSSSSGYTQDPFIKQMEERIKFMKDFQKGYEDLSKFMTKGTALSKESETMLTRGLSIGLSAEEQRRAAEDLSKWYEDTLNSTFDYLKKNKGVTGSIQEFLSRQITGSSNQDKMLRDFQSLLQSLFDAKTDFDTTQLKKDMEEALKKVSDELKRSETARGFFKNILDLTGDEELAATLSVSVYGGIGDDFKDRMQKQLDGALASLKVSEGFRVNDDIVNAFKDMDFEKIFAIENLPENVEKVVREAYEATQKYNAQIANDYAKLLLKYDDIKQQEVNITNKARKDEADIEKGLQLEIEGIRKKYEADPAKQAEMIKAAEDRARAVKEAVGRQEKLDLSRLEKDYRLFFSSIGTISEEAARRVAANQKKMLTEQFERHEISYSQYVRELSRVNEQLEKYESNTSVFRTYLSGGVDAVASKFKDMASSIRAISNTMEVSGGDRGIFSIDDTSKEYIDKIGSIMGGKAFSTEGVSGRKNVASQLVEAISKISKDSEEFKKNMSAALEAAASGADSFASSFSQGLATAGFWVTNVSTLIKELDEFNNDSLKTPKWLDALASTVTWTLGVAGSEAWDRLANLNEYATSGFEKLSQGNIVGALIDNIKGLVDFWGPNIKKINREIKEQDHLLEDLEYEYSRLDVAMEKAFGSEYIYNYNKQLEVLQAKADAYQKQAELERSKGKKADEETARGYEKSAREVADQIEDMQTQLSEFFSGTDLTSAAEDFANAWIEAYKEFGSTTDAMSEKFNDMIQSMINRSLAAKIMQEMLQPIFDQIDAMSKDGLLATDEIAAIAALAQERIPLINDAMTNLMTSLAAAGLDVRTSTEGFKGISRNIANASEESILGLAAAVNTQNFYMSYVPKISEDVALILESMTGGTVGPKRSKGIETEGEDIIPSVQQMVYDHLPHIDQTLEKFYDLFKSVTTSKTATQNTNYVAIK